MAGKIYIVEGRQFKSDAEYKQALKDQETIEKLREMMTDADLSQLKALSGSLEKGKYRFSTLLGDDFADELDEKIKSLERRQLKAGGRSGTEDKSQDKARDRAQDKVRDKSVDKEDKSVKQLDLPRRRLADSKEQSSDESGLSDEEIEIEARKILKRRDIRRRIILILSVGIGLISVAFFIFYMATRTDTNNDAFYQLRDKAEKEHSAGRIDSTGSAADNTDIVIHYTDSNTIEAVVLPEFEEMLGLNSKLIGWLTIDGTTIDYPVAQTNDNEYYLTHDLSQNYDRNGTIFLDTNCDVLKPSTNFILYGHHMQSGKMFGKLNKYEDENYYKKHKYITFDTIYEYGTYEVMYVFRSHVFEETEIAFKYYQFIDAYSEVEFDSYMNEMASMSLYDTGVTAQYGDRLLTLSTCDYQEKNGRFVVVAKKIK